MNRFTKIGASGEELSADATEWVVVKDTGPAECPYVKPRYFARETSSERLTFKNAQKYAKGLNVAGFTDWRVPTVLELSLLADRTRHDPAIDTAFFPECKPNAHWTSDVDASSPGYAWSVTFDYGSVLWGYQDGSAFVRAVRGGQ